jgi:hypothetical protein
MCGVLVYVYNINKTDYWHCRLKSHDIPNRSTRKPFQRPWLLDLLARTRDKYVRFWDVFIRSTVGNIQQIEIKVKVKVKFILEQAMKAQSGSGGIILLFL